MAWRRKYDQRPPPLGEDSPIQRHLLEDERYAGESVPSAESLQETCTRVDEIWTEQIKPSLQAGQNVMVVAHGNTLRALVKLVDGVSEEDKDGRRRADDVLQLRKQSAGEHAAEEDVQAGVQVKPAEHFPVDSAERGLGALE